MQHLLEARGFRIVEAPLLVSGGDGGGSGSSAAGGAITAGTTPLQRTKPLTLDRVEACFSKPIKQAANELGICTTLLKKICRQHGIKRWPYRKVTSIQKQKAGGSNA